MLTTVLEVVVQCLLLSWAGAANYDVSSCCTSAGCKNVNYMNIQYPLTFDNTPLYTQIQTNVGYADKVDSECFTYFPINKCNSTYLRFRSTKYENGTYSITPQIVGSNKACFGVLRNMGARTSSGCSTCVANDYVLGTVCSAVSVIYRCLLFGSCNGVDDQRDFVYAVSPTRNISDCCKDRIVSIAESSGLDITPGFMELPNKYPSACVAKFNGAYAINSNSIKRGDSIAIP